MKGDAREMQASSGQEESWEFLAESVMHAESVELGGHNGRWDQTEGGHLLLSQDRGPETKKSSKNRGGGTRGERTKGRAKEKGSA